jgi:hypothetical protein
MAEENDLESVDTATGEIVPVDTAPGEIVPVDTAPGIGNDNSNSSVLSPKESEQNTTFVNKQELPVKQTNPSTTTLTTSPSPTTPTTPPSTDPLPNSNPQGSIVTIPPSASASASSALSASGGAEKSEYVILSDTKIHPEETILVPLSKFKHPSFPKNWKDMSFEQLKAIPEALSMDNSSMTNITHLNTIDNDFFMPKIGIPIYFDGKKYYIVKFPNSIHLVVVDASITTPTYIPFIESLEKAIEKYHAEGLSWDPIWKQLLRIDAHLRNRKVFPSLLKKLVKTGVKWQWRESYKLPTRTKTNPTRTKTNPTVGGGKRNNKTKKRTKK